MVDELWHISALFSLIIGSKVKYQRSLREHIIPRRSTKADVFMSFYGTTFLRQSSTDAVNCCFLRASSLCAEHCSVRWSTRLWMHPTISRTPATWKLEGTSQLLVCFTPVQKLWTRRTSENGSVISYYYELGKVISFRIMEVKQPCSLESKSKWCLF